MEKVNKEEVQSVRIRPRRFEDGGMIVDISIRLVNGMRLNETKTLDMSQIGDCINPDKSLDDVAIDLVNSDKEGEDKVDS